MTSKATLAELIDPESSETVAVFERLRRWLELHPGVLVTMRAAQVDGQPAAVVCVSRGYDFDPAGTCVAVVHNDRSTWPLLEALKRASGMFERTLQSEKGAA